MKNRAVWFLLGFVFLFIGGLWALSASSFQSDATEYRENGITVKGTVKSGESMGHGRKASYDLVVRYKLKKENEQKLDISKGIIPTFSMSDYKTVECQLMSGNVFDMLHLDDEVDVIYLPENPEENTILAMSILEENVTPIHKMGIAQIMLIGGAVMMLIGFLIRSKD